VVVYCGKCKLVYAITERNRWGNYCIRCGGKLITEIKDWLAVVDNSLRGENADG